jgi:hypothetical protein
MLLSQSCDENFFVYFFAKISIWAYPYAVVAVYWLKKNEFSI